jgi:sugar phosphate isomerase/epimerase
MNTRQPFKIGVTLHSFTEEYVNFKWSFEDMMQKASLLGGGVEIVGPSHHRGFPEVTREFERIFKSALERYHLTPTCYGSYADPFMLPDRNLTPEEIFEYTVPQLKGAAKLGFPVVRLQHYTSVAAEQLIPYAEKLNLKMGYELHSPLMIEAPLTQDLLEQIVRLGSDRLGLIPDCGIFARSISEHHIDRVRESGIPESMIQKALELWAQKIEKDQAVEMMQSYGADKKTLNMVGHFWGSFGFSEPSALADIKSYIFHVHGKFYSIVDGDEPNLRYEEVVKTLLDINYTGWMSSEFEGEHADSFEIVKAHQAMVNRYIQKHLPSETPAF